MIVSSLNKYELFELDWYAKALLEQKKGNEKKIKSKKQKEGKGKQSLIKVGTLKEPLSLIILLKPQKHFSLP